MPRKKKQRGRPPIRPLPPKADATPEELAWAFFKARPGDELDMPQKYLCRSYGEVVQFPNILYRDGRCEDCHKTPVK